jgi:hypothetical protein
MLVFPLSSFCQDESTYNLLTERNIDRPIFIHKGQLQLNAGYDFAIINKKFDPDGSLIDLTEDGSASVKHLFPVAISYGILDYIQLSTSIDYSSTGIRSQYEAIYSGSTTLFRSEVNSYKGFDDLYLGIDLTDPFKLYFLDWTLSGGLFIPLFDNEPDKPSHSITYVEPPPGSRIINYQYNNKASQGIPVFRIGSAFKLRSKKFAMVGAVYYEKGLKDGESIYWQERLVDEDFEYMEAEYEYNIGQSFNYHAVLSFQAIDWFTIWISYEGDRWSGGWSNKTGKKIGQIKSSINYASIGYEILVSPHLRLIQQIRLPFAGKNILAYWSFQTGISLNYFSYLIK